MWTETEVTADASTSTRATTWTVTPKWWYCKTVQGILRIVELVLGVLVCALANPVQCTYLSPCSAPLDQVHQGEFSGQGFVIFVGVLFLIGNFVWIIAYVFIWQEEKPKYFDLVEFVYVCCATFFYFVAACVEAWYASIRKISSMPELNPFRPSWIACAVFAWFNFILYTADILLWLSKQMHLFKRSVGPSTATTNAPNGEVSFQSTMRHPPAPGPKVASEEPKVYIVDRNGYQFQTLV